MNSNTNPYVGTIMGSNGTITINSDTTHTPFLTVSDSVTTITTPLVVNGRDVMKELDEMRDALLLLKRDVDMETKYPELAEAKRQYEEILDKYKTWDALNYGN